jgi:hypothetical protein
MNEFNISARQLMAEQSCFDERFKGKTSKAILIDKNQNMSILTECGEIIPYENKVNKNKVELILAVFVRSSV